MRTDKKKLRLKEEEVEKGVITKCSHVPSPHFRTRMSSPRLSVGDRYDSHLLRRNLTSDN